MIARWKTKTTVNVVVSTDHFAAVVVDPGGGAVVVDPGGDAVLDADVAPDVACPHDHVAVAAVDVDAVNNADSDNGEFPGAVEFADVVPAVFVVVGTAVGIAAAVADPLRR